MATDEEGLLGRYRQRRKSSRSSFGSGVAASVVRLSIFACVLLSLFFIIFSLGFSIFSTFTGPTPLEEEQMGGKPIFKTGGFAKIELEKSFQYKPLKENEVFRKDILLGGNNDNAPIKRSDKVTVHYIGYHTNGAIFDTSKSPGRTPFQFEVGAGHVIKGWDEGVLGLRKGDIVRLTIAPEYAYGKRGSPPSIRPDETLIFGIEVLDVLSSSIPAAATQEKEKTPPVPAQAPKPANPVVKPTQIFGPNEFIYVPLEKNKPWRREVLKQAPENAVAPKKFDVLKVEYTGYLVDGKIFNSSKLEGHVPLKFGLGIGDVIKGLDEAALEMKKGEISRLTVSSEYAYGSKGDGELVGPDSTLIIVIELVDIEPATGPTVPKTPDATERKDEKSPVRTREDAVFSDAEFKYTPLDDDMGWSKDILKKGDDDAPRPQIKDRIKIHYTGYFEDGRVFESSKTSGRGPSESPIGVDRFIKGWEEALLTMKKGEISRVTISPDFAYGSRGNPPKIPPDATLIFVIEMIDIIPAS